MPTLSESDKEQVGLDWRMEDLRRQIPENTKEGKPLSAMERLKLEKELDDLRNMNKEPERPSTFEYKPSTPSNFSQAQTETQKSREVIVEEQEKQA